ncbi:MAG TPA: DCC1-like thiol-disulfide oxidoreductase family protein [Vicinamibacterales bacterium]|nr:DCC1-like thiol-disulfide oxidoreductase family protein [Vicinamibacterales bacterium]
MDPAPVERVVLFDGVCNLCNGLVQFIIRRDPHARFKFAAMTSFEDDTLVLVEDGRKYVRSDAVLRIARRLRAPWPLLYAFIVVPRPLRDWAYDIVARRRYRWFGRREACMVPTPELRARFVEYPNERGR